MTSATRTDKQIVGQLAEDRALSYLQQQGMVLVQRNFLCRGGEIDLIMRDGKALVFVEVRKRAHTRFGGAAASVTPTKQRRLVSAAQQFLQQQRCQSACRFDVIAIDGDILQWLKNVIEA